MSMSNQFAEPASSTGIEWGTLNGCLLIVQPSEVVRGIVTSLGPRDAVRATVTVIDGPHAGTNYPDTLIFPKVLQSQVSSRIGQMVLGRLGQGQAKPGQNPPWMLNPAGPADQQAAGAYLATHATATPLVPGDLA